MLLERGTKKYFRIGGIFMTHGSKLGLPRCRQTLYHLRHQRSLLEDHQLDKKSLCVFIVLYIGNGLPRWLSDEESACQCRRRRSEGQSLDSKDPLEKEMTTHSSILAWKIPWTERPGRLWYVGLQKSFGHDLATQPM